MCKKFFFNTKIMFLDNVPAQKTRPKSSYPTIPSITPELDQDTFGQVPTTKKPPPSQPISDGKATYPSDTTLQGGLRPTSIHSDPAGLAGLKQQISTQISTHDSQVGSNKSKQIPSPKIEKRYEDNKKIAEGQEIKRTKQENEKARKEKDKKDKKQKKDKKEKSNFRNKKVRKQYL